MFKRLLDKLEIRYGRYAGIRNLMTGIVFAMAAVFVMDLVFAPMLGFTASQYLMFDRAKVMQGQIWRIITFIFLPPSSSIIFILISLMFYFYLGNTLQTAWGTFRFNVFYFTGLAGSLIAGFITGTATNYYLNMSLFLAVAILFPNREINLYGILPIRMKWLAIVDLVMILLPLLYARPGQYLDILLPAALSLLNVILFFYDRFIKMFSDMKRRREWKKAWKK